ncbi:MAG: hypothetical protein V8Q57_02135 [Blautia sp.]
MKNWKKIMAMLCTAAMLTGSALPVWAEDAAETEDAAAAADEYTELTMDMLEEQAYEGSWLSFEAGFDLYVPSDWDVVELKDEDKEQGIVFAAKAADDSGINMVVMANEVGTDYDDDKLVAEFTDAGYTEIEKDSINTIKGVSFETESTYGFAFLDGQGYMYNIQVAPKGDDTVPIAQTLLISLSLSENVEEEATPAEEEAVEEEAAN